MAGTSLLALLDDIASVLDDIALMTKVAAKKTAGVLGDDLALNAEQVSGVRAERELPVVWAVAKGSLRNKAILVPLALLLSALIPWIVSPLLMLGGIYLCFEGFEKIAHKWLHSRQNHKPREAEATGQNQQGSDLVAFERKKIKGAIRTDFILSAEIIVIALGTVQGEPLINQVVVVSGIAILMTVGVYAFVAGIVKLDDLGVILISSQRAEPVSRTRLAIGNFLVRLAPYLMKTLSVVGTIAMFMVGGGILIHGIPGGHHLTEIVHQHSPQGLTMLLSTLVNSVTGLIAGGLATSLLTLIKAVFLQQPH